MCGVLEGLVAASTAMGVAGANQQARAQSAAAEYQAQVAERNAKLAMQDSQRSAELERLGNLRQVDLFKARQSNSGVSTASGSPFLARMQLSRDLESNARMIEYEGQKAAIGARDDAGAFRRSAKQYRTDGRLGAASALLDGATTAYHYNRQGFFKDPDPAPPNYPGGLGPLA